MHRSLWPRCLQRWEAGRQSCKLLHCYNTVVRGFEPPTRWSVHWDCKNCKTAPWHFLFPLWWRKTEVVFCANTGSMAICVLPSLIAVALKAQPRWHLKVQVWTHVDLFFSQEPKLKFLYFCNKLVVLLCFQEIGLPEKGQVGSQKWGILCTID